MNARIALLLCALLLLAGCATPAKAAAPVWSDEEIAYLDSVFTPLGNMLPKMSGVINRPKDGAAILEYNKVYQTFASHLPAPATLAVVEYYMKNAVAYCGPASTSGMGLSGNNECLATLDTINLELARIYAARGSYPPN